MENDQDYGQRCTESSQQSNQDGLSQRTSQHSLSEDLISSLDNLPKSGILLNGTLSSLPVLEQTTSEKERLLLPTIRASEYKGCGPKGSKSHNHWIKRFYLSAIVTDSGKLNPTFAELMMGFPIGHTDLNV